MIRLFVTGGTIDGKAYNKEGKSTFFSKSIIPKMVKQSRCRSDLEVTTLMLKDSLDITENDREKILSACKEAKEKKILITHGTYTMPETAKYLGERIKNKVVILFGSIVPFSYNGSDALFNFGFAISSIGTLKNGVYIAMNGKIFNWANVKKNNRKQIFETNK